MAQPDSPLDHGILGPSPQPVYRVVLADDDPAVRQALSDLISDHPQLQIVGVASDGFEAAEICATKKPDLAVLDVMMSGGGVSGVGAVLGASHETVVVAYTADSDSRTRNRLLSAGAAAVFVKGGGIDLTSALHDVIASARASN